MNYGFSPLPAATSGADVQISTNSQIVQDSGGVSQSGYVQWSTRLHSAGNQNGAGNLLLGDGSVQQQVTSAGLRTNWVHFAVDNGNYGPGGPAALNAIRLVFP